MLSSLIRENLCLLVVHTLPRPGENSYDAAAGFARCDSREIFLKESDTLLTTTAPQGIMIISVGE
jgi:hypothetical protein